VNPQIAARRAGTWALRWTILALIISAPAHLLTWWRTGSDHDLSAGTTILSPLSTLAHLPDLAGPYHSAHLIRPWLYAWWIITLAVGIWIVLLRHGIADPRRIGKSTHDLPLAERLRPQLKDVGIWTDYDASRPTANTPRWARVRYQLMTLLPGYDSATIPWRPNGMLVPADRPQPQGRIYLGVHSHQHLIRRKRYHVYARPEHHVAVFGPSGTGKGASQMNPSLLFWSGTTEGSPDGHGVGWPGALVTATVKNDHVEVSLGWRSQLSDQCYIYDPLQMYPDYQHMWVGWNPLDGISTFSEATKVAAALMDSEKQQGGGGGGGNEEYFIAQALMILGPMMLSAAIKGYEFKRVYEWALTLEGEGGEGSDATDASGNVSPDSAMYEVLEPLYDYRDSTGDGTPLSQMEQIFAKDPREASGIWGSVRKSLQPYNDGKSVNATSAKTMPRMFNPETFYTTPGATLYIIAPEVASEGKRMRPVFAAFISWLIEQGQAVARANNGKLPQPALLNLDEVKNVGAIPGLAHTLSLTRSAGIFVKHAWQDEAQIESAYGKDDAKTITGNSRTWAMLPGISDPEHLDKLSRLVGERKNKKVQPGGKGEKRNVTYEHGRIVDAADLKELRDDELLVIADNLPPVLINQNRYYADPIMRQRSSMSPRDVVAPVTTSPAPAADAPTPAPVKKSTAPGALIPWLPADLDQACIIVDVAWLAKHGVTSSPRNLHVAVDATHAHITLDTTHLATLTLASCPSSWIRAMRTHGHVTLLVVTETDPTWSSAPPASHTGVSPTHVLTSQVTLPLDSMIDDTLTARGLVNAIEALDTTGASLVNAANTIDQDHVTLTMIDKALGNPLAGLTGTTWTDSAGLVHLDSHCHHARGELRPSTGSWNLEQNWCTSCGLDQHADITTLPPGALFDHLAPIIATVDELARQRQTLQSGLPAQLRTAALEATSMAVAKIDHANQPAGTSAGKDGDEPGHAAERSQVLVDAAAALALIRTAARAAHAASNIPASALPGGGALEQAGDKLSRDVEAIDTIITWLDSQMPGHGEVLTSRIIAGDNLGQDELAGLAPILTDMVTWITSRPDHHSALHWIALPGHLTPSGPLARAYASRYGWLGHPGSPWCLIAAPASAVAALTPEGNIDLGPVRPHEAWATARTILHASRNARPETIANITRALRAANERIPAPASTPPAAAPGSETQQH